MNHSLLFPELPDRAQVWTYGARRPVPADVRQRLVEGLRTFMAHWTSHGRAVQCAVQFLYDRFLVIAAYVPGDALSGCGVDASTDAVADISEALGIEWAGPLDVFYRAGHDEIISVSRSEFRTRSSSGMITGDTVVFDLSVTTLGELRNGRWETEAAASWHHRLLAGETLREA